MTKCGAAHTSMFVVMEDGKTTVRGEEVRCVLPEGHGGSHAATPTTKNSAFYKHPGMVHRW